MNKVVRYFIVMVVAILVASVFSAHASRIEPLQALEALRKGFGATADFTADITQEKKLSLMKRQMVMNGIIRFKKPDLFYMELSPPFATRLLMRDTVIEQATGKRTERSKIILPPEQSLKRWFEKLSQPVTTLPEGVTLRADYTASLYTLTIAPADKGQVKELTIIFQDDGTIRRLIIDEQNGDRATLIFRKMRRNVGLSEKDFTLE